MPTHARSSTAILPTLAALAALAASGGGPLRAQQAAVPAAPLGGYTTHVVATHFLEGRAYEAHHYFKGLRDGVLQGIVFRTSDGGAALIEIEWAISKTVYDALPAADKRHWHPLFPAVDAGRVRLPDLEPAKEKEMLRTVRGLYAQTINLAGIDGALPRGLGSVRMVTHLTAQEMRQVMQGGRTR